jgi:hypothetical protein
VRIATLGKYKLGVEDPKKAEKKKPARSISPKKKVPEAEKSKEEAEAEAEKKH